MEKFLQMVDQTSEVSNTQQMNEDLFKEFLSKNPVWDFDNISREEYIAKSNSEKESLIINYYNEMVKGKSLICIVLVFVLYLIKVKVHIVTNCNCGLFSLASCFDSSISVSFMFPKWVFGWVSAAILTFHKYLCSIYIAAVTTVINFF